MSWMPIFLYEAQSDTKKNVCKICVILDSASLQKLYKVILQHKPLNWQDFD